jgi:hypothetical protein
MSIQRYTSAELVSVVKSLCGKASEVNNEIHVVGVNVLEHTMQHGDFTAGETLLNGLPKGQRVKALAFWFSKFSNDKLRFELVDGVYKGVLAKKRDASDFDIEGAEAMHFADLTNEKDPKPATVKAILKALAGKATNANTFEGTDIPMVEPAARAFASRLLALAKSDPELAKLAA